MAKFFEKYFKLSENKTTVKTEIIAGLTTFFAMCYIVVVNPNSMIGNNPEYQHLWNAVFVGGLIAGGLTTILMAFLGKLPFALAAGMGLNSYFFVSFILPVLAGFGGTNNVNDAYGAGLAVILLSGVVFLILSVTGLRSKIAKALPECLKKSIPAGIGLFIALLGFKSAGIIVSNQFTFVALADLRTWAVAAVPIAAFLGLIITTVLGKFKFKANIILGILATTVMYYLFTWTAPEFSGQSIGTVFGDFFEYGLFNLRFDLAFDGTTIGSVFSVIMIMIAFTLVDMFDTIGTLYGTAAEADMLDENGDPVRLEKAMLCDSVGTCLGGLVGTSTITTFVESSTGVAAGGRTGLTSLVTGICLLLCLFISPLATIIPSAATAPALIFVGVLMLKNFASVDMTDLRSAVPAFLALILMPLTYSISNGIGVAAIAYVLITVFTGKYEKKDIVVTIIAVLFALKFWAVVM